MIRSFGCKDTEKLWKGEKTKKWRQEVKIIGLRKLFMLHASHNISDLRIPPSNRLHSLKDDLKGFHSISINMQWRIIFKWKGNDTYHVEITDYH